MAERFGRGLITLTIHRTLWRRKLSPVRGQTSGKCCVSGWFLGLFPLVISPLICVVERFIQVAQILLQKRNFQSLFAVMGGLSLNCISRYGFFCVCLSFFVCVFHHFTRLSDLWEKAVDSKLAPVYQNLKEVVSSQNNFKRYRASERGLFVCSVNDTAHLS